MTPVAAEGCALCDAPRRGHGQRWVRVVGYHAWVAPSKAQIATRIRLRFAMKGRMPR